MLTPDHVENDVRADGRPLPVAEPLLAHRAHRHARRLVNSTIPAIFFILFEKKILNYTCRHVVAARLPQVTHPHRGTPTPIHCPFRKRLHSAKTKLYNSS